jgi:hypothetical protein
MGLSLVGQGLRRDSGVHFHHDRRGLTVTVGRRSGLVSLGAGVISYRGIGGSIDGGGSCRVARGLGTLRLNLCRWSNRRRIVGSRQVNRPLARGSLARVRSSVVTVSLLAGGFDSMTFDAARRRRTSFFTRLFRRAVAKADGGVLV